MAHPTYEPKSGEFDIPAIAKGLAGKNSETITFMENLESDKKRPGVYNAVYQELLIFKQQAKLAKAQAQLQKSTTQLDQSKSQLEQSKTQLNQSKAQLDKIKKMQHENTIIKNELKAAQITTQYHLHKSLGNNVISQSEKKPKACSCVIS